MEFSPVALVTDLLGKQLCWLNQNQVFCKSYNGNEVQTLHAVGSSRLTVMCSYNGFLMVANEIGILQTINISSNKNFLYMNTSLAICYISVLDKSHLSGTSFHVLINNVIVNLIFSCRKVFQIQTSQYRVS